MTALEMFVMRTETENVLKDLLAALPLCGEACDGPHLDLYTGVKLLSPHVPHTVTGRGHGPVLQEKAQG